MCEHFGLGLYVSEGSSCSVSSEGSLCPWFAKLAALLWNDFLHPWKASASQPWCARALSVSDQQLGCGVYAVLCNLSFVPLGKLEPGAGQHLFRIGSGFFVWMISSHLPYLREVSQMESFLTRSVNHLLAGHSCEETCL